MSRRALLRGAGVAGVALAAGTLSVAGAGSAQASQTGWRWCSKCQGLWYGGNRDSFCPADFGPHSSAGSGNYLLAQRGGTTAADGADQYSWAWCRYCQGLWFTGPNGPAGLCPNTTYGHSWQGSSDYGLVFSPTPFTISQRQRGWFWCHQCQGLWYSGNNTAGHCPLGIGHSSEGSSVYGMYIT